MACAVAFAKASDGLRVFPRCLFNSAGRARWRPRRLASIVAAKICVSQPRRQTPGRYRGSRASGRGCFDSAATMFWYMNPATAQVANAPPLAADAAPSEPISAAEARAAPSL